MGYESKVLIGYRCSAKYPNGKAWVYFHELMRLDLCKMGYEIANNRYFTENFKKEIDFHIYVKSDSDTETMDDFYFDCYGEHCKYTTPEELIPWLEASQTAKEYNRAKMLLDVLRYFVDNKESYGDLVVVHYGY